MKIVPRFLALLLLPQFLQADPPARMQACGLAMEIPAGFGEVQTTGDSLRAQSTGLPRWTLVGYCVANQFKTDRSEVTLAEFKKNGDYLRNVITVPLQGGFSATVFRRTPASQPVQRIEAVFSSRDYQYHLVLVPDESRSVTVDQWKGMQDLLVAALHSVQLSGQDPAISEQKYALRLAGFALVCFVLLAGAAWMLLGKKLRRRRK